MTEESLTEDLRIGIYSKHDLFRAGATGLLGAVQGFAVEDLGKRIREATGNIRAMTLDLVIWIVAQPMTRDVEEIKQILTAASGTPVMAITTVNRGGFLDELINIGCSGICSTEGTADELLRVIDLAIEGEASLNLDALTANHLAAQQRSDNNLSDIETRILQLSAQGLTQSNIAEELFVSRATVSSHLQQAHMKLGVTTTTAAVAAAQERHLFLPA